MIRKPFYIVLVLLISLVGCQSAPSPDSEQQDEIASMEKVKNYDGLISYYKSELEKGSKDPQIKEKLAWAYFHKGDLESADFYVQHLQKEGVKNPSLYQLEGQVFDAKNDTDNAIGAYLDSIKSGNQSGQVHVLLGVSYTKAGSYKEAYKQLNEARLRGYDDVVIKNNLAMIYMANGDYQKAVEMLTPILKENPSNKIVKANLAIALMKVQQVDAARKLLKGEFSDQELRDISAELTQYRS